MGLWSSLKKAESSESKGFPHSSVGKESAYNAEDLGSIPGSGRPSGEGNGNPLQYSCLENPMDRGAWWAKVHGATRVRHDLVTKTNQWSKMENILFNSFWWKWKMCLLFLLKEHISQTTYFVFYSIFPPNALRNEQIPLYVSSIRKK